METANKTTITVETTVNAPVEKVWQSWTRPEHIMQWNNASDDWHTPRAENDLRVGGSSLHEWKQRTAALDLILVACMTTFRKTDTLNIPLAMAAK